jgi:hypothetical protein
MRKLALVFSLLALAACGSDSPTAPTNGPVYFRIDGLTCRGSDAITFYIDGTPVGTETLAAGGYTSSPYMASIGSHALGAKEVNSPFYTWPTTFENVPAAGMTFLLTC